LPIKIIRFLVILSVCFSCTQPLRDGLERRNLNEYYSSSRVVRYFLTELPTWANFSTTGKCRRHTSIRYLDAQLVRGSFSLSYEEVVQLQALFNVEMRRLMKEKKVNHIPFREEERVFFKQTDKIQAKIRIFRAPDYKRVHLVWIDHALADKVVLGKLKALMKRDSFLKGHPVFVSQCLSREELDQFIVGIGKGRENIRKISSDFFIPFDREGKPSYKFFLSLKDFFKPEQKLILYTPGGIQPQEFGDKMNIKTY
jgi:hypothetical protein